MMAILVEPVCFHSRSPSDTFYQAKSTIILIQGIQAPTKLV